MLIPMSAQPFVIPGAPQALLDIINARRATIPPGMTMTATATEGANAGAEGEANSQKPGEGGANSQKPGEGGASGQKQETDAEKIARLERELASTRDETAKKRITAKEQAANEREAETVQKVLAALGLNKDGEKVVNADELATKLQAEQAKTKSLQMREAVRDAVDDPAEAGRLLKHTDFLDAVQGLEPGDTEGIKKAVAATLTANPWLKSAPGARGKSGTDMSGGTGEGAKAKATSLEQAVAARYAS